MKTLKLEPYCNDCPHFRPAESVMMFFDNHSFGDFEVSCEYARVCDYAVTANDELKKMQREQDEQAI